MLKRSIIPNLVTFGNLFLGYIVILMVVQERFSIACWLLVIAAIMDGLDGLVARLVHQSSRFGAEMDSLADAISFGLAPSLLIYHAVLEPLGIIGLLLAFFPLIAGIIRLARYNVGSTAKRFHNSFSGMPIPASALVLTSLYLYAGALPGNVSLVPAYMSLAPLLSLLMLSPIRYRRLPVVPVRNSRHAVAGKFILITAAGLMLWNPALTMFPLMVIYLAIGPVEWVIRHLRHIRDIDSIESPGDEFDPLE